MINLNKIREFLAECVALTDEDRHNIASKTSEIVGRIEKEPKTTTWKMRENIGPRKKFTALMCQSIPELWDRLSRRQKDIHMCASGRKKLLLQVLELEPYSVIFRFNEIFTFSRFALAKAPPASSTSITPTKDTSTASCSQAMLATSSAR
jgi:hypothetical protein